MAALSLTREEAIHLQESGKLDDLIDAAQRLTSYREGMIDNDPRVVRMRVALDEITRLQRAGTLRGPFQPEEMHKQILALDKADSLMEDPQKLEALCHKAANTIRDLLHQIMELSGERDSSP